MDKEEKERAYKHLLCLKNLGMPKIPIPEHCDPIVHALFRKQEPVNVKVCDKKVIIDPEYVVNIKWTEDDNPQESLGFKSISADVTNVITAYSSFKRKCWNPFVKEMAQRGYNVSVDPETSWLGITAKSQEPKGEVCDKNVGRVHQNNTE